jgi:hypothetical protein
VWCQPVVASVLNGPGLLTSGSETPVDLELLEVARELTGGAVAVLRISGHGLEDDGFEAGREVGPEVSGPSRRHSREAGTDARKRNAGGELERTLKRERLKQRDPERIHVAQDLIGRCFQEPLRRHVHGSSCTVAHLFSSGNLEIASQTEVAEINSKGSLAVEQDVSRLDVAVDHSLGVDLVESAGGAGHGASSCVQVMFLVEVDESMPELDMLSPKVAPAAADHFLEGGSLNIGHGHVEEVLGLAEFEDLKQGGTVEQSPPFGFTAELSQPMRLLGQSRVENLESHDFGIRIEPFGFPDVALGTSSQPPNQPKRPDGHSGPELALDAGWQLGGDRNRRPDRNQGGLGVDHGGGRADHEGDVGPKAPLPFLCGHDPGSAPLTEDLVIPQIGDGDHDGFLEPPWFGRPGPKPCLEIEARLVVLRADGVRRGERTDAGFTQG